jgi:hypothetical protein
VHIFHEKRPEGESSTDKPFPAFDYAQQRDERVEISFQEGKGTLKSVNHFFRKRPIIVQPKCKL